MDLARLVGHCCFENEELSKNIAKKLLSVINRATGDDIQPSLEVLYQYLLINDSLKPMRYEWTLGIPFLRFMQPTSYQVATNAT